MLKTSALKCLAPLASVVVVNFNYGRFLRTAVDSVFAQTYPNVQCIIVDDASTDTSGEILDGIVNAYPTARILRRRENGGQLAACLEGLANSDGAYVAFLDADDFLFEHFVAAHVYVHLSLRDAVGFSCSDMVQLSGSQMVIGGFPSLAHYVGSNPPTARSRPLHSSIHGEWLDSVDRNVIERAYQVDPSERNWPWSSTSGFFFRRDALNLWTKTPALSQLRRSPDGFFGQAINAITGSVVIDEALGAYRVHGTNVFSRGIPLAHLRHFDSTDETGANYRRILLNEIVRDPARFAFYWPSRLLDVIDTLDEPVAGAKRPQTTSTALQCVQRNYDHLTGHVGKKELDRWLFSKRLHLLKHRFLGH